MGNASYWLVLLYHSPVLADLYQPNPVGDHARLVSRRRLLSK